jgi:hypothetical protein
LDEIPGSLPEPGRDEDLGGDRRLDSPYRGAEKLKEEIKLLRSLPASKSVIVTWNNLSIQVHYEEPHAIEALSKAIKDKWAIPRKYYWLKVNGIHEAGLTEWPQVANASVEIRGLGAGTGRSVGPTEFRICIEEKISTEDWKYDFEFIFVDRKVTPPDEIWATNRQRISTSNKPKKFIDTGTEKIFAFDKIIPSDPETLKRGAIEKVKLNVEGQIFETWNNMSSEASLREQEITGKSQKLEGAFPKNQC